MVLLIAVLCLSGTTGSQPVETDDRIAFAPDAVIWTDAPPTLPKGSKLAVLEGNPRSEGLFTMRVRVPAGSALHPHWHPRHERVTVLSGTVELGFGSVADPRNVTRYGAGSFYVNPPRVMHFAFFTEDTEVQLTGVGPWESHTTDIEPRVGAKPTANIIVRSITPAPGTELTPETELVAEVDYSITSFRPETFFMTMQFESIVPNQTFNASSAIMGRPGEPPPPPPEPEMLTSARGTATVRQNMEGVLRHKSLKRPIRMRVFVHEQATEASSTVVETSDWIEFR